MLWVLLALHCSFAFLVKNEHFDPQLHPISTHFHSFPLHERSSNVAIIMYGVARALNDTINSIKKNITDVYNADVFFAGPRDDQSEVIAQLHTNLKSILFTKQYSVTEITALFEAMPDVKYFQKWGGKNANAIGPANGRPGSNLFLMLWQSLAYDLMVAYEFQYNHQYEWVLSVRPDMDFAVPLPPVDVLRKARERHGHSGHDKVVWVMNSNQHYMGITDRFAIMSRNASDVCFGRWKAMLTGTFASKVNYNDGRKYKYDDGNPVNEWAVTAGFRNSFKGWNANML